ncbi:MAG TPA: VanZ family protein [Fimbriiglobus sp.]
MTEGPPPFPTARTFAGFTLGVVALTIYGSLVPFESQPRSFSDAVNAFEWVLHHRNRLESRSDGAANFILGFPLGYCLLGAFRIDHFGRVKSLVTAMILIPPCIAFSSAVEFAQLWFPKRTCSTTDIEAQTLGSTTGMAVWIFFGQKIVDWVRGVYATDRFGGKRGRILLVYLIVLLAIQVLPFDVSTSPGEVYKRIQDGKSVTVRPFAECAQIATEAKRVEKIVAWMRLAGVFLPVGILAAGLPGFWRTWAGFPGAMASAVLLGIGMELAQVPILSRHASTTDVMIVSAAMILGWVGALAVRRLGSIVYLGFAVGWTMFLIATGWYPFDFAVSAADRVTAWNLIPFAAIETKQYLMLLNEVLEVVVLYGPLGAAAGGVANTRHPRVGGVAAAGVAGTIELGQFWLAARTPATTDILLAAVGGALGAYVCMFIRTDSKKGFSA